MNDAKSNIREPVDDRCPDCKEYIEELEADRSVVDDIVDLINNDGRGKMFSVVSVSEIIETHRREAGVASGLE